MITIYPSSSENEIKVLQLLNSPNGIHFREVILKEMNLENLPYYAILAIARDLEKRGLSANNDGVLYITEKGEKYLTELLNEN